MHYNRLMVAGLILAGGESRRLGTPKALLKVGAETFAKRIVSIMHSVGIQNLTLVAGPHYEEIRKSADDLAVVFNPQYELGQFSSLQTGLRHVPGGTEFVLVWPVDQPLVRKETISELLETARREGNPVTVPVYEGKKGHPVVYNSETITKILSMEPSHTGKELFEYFDGRISLVEVNDPGVLIDIDTPEDYETYITRARL